METQQTQKSFPAQHSCDPNLGVDLQSPDREEWRVVALKDIKAGEELTWFYPSTEWDAVSLIINRRLPALTRESQWGGGFPCGCKAMVSADLSRLRSEY